MQTMYMPDGIVASIRLIALQKVFQRKCCDDWLQQEQVIVYQLYFFILYVVHNNVYLKLSNFIPECNFLFIFLQYTIKNYCQPLDLSLSNNIYSNYKMCNYIYLFHNLTFIQSLSSLNNNKIVMKTSNQIIRRTRALSAKAPSTRSRPMSSHTSKNFQKTQVMQGIYNGPRQASPGKRTNTKSFVYQGINTEQLAKYKRPSTVVTTKDKEQLFQQNMRLKKDVNRLHDELIIIKGKFEARGRKTKQRNKQLDIQFEKPLYWGGSKSHLISGIKFQYQKLKKDHIDLQTQHRNLKIELNESKLPQIKIYSQALENQNSRLQSQLMRIFQSQQKQPSNETNKQMLDYMYAESQENNRKLQKKIQELTINLQNSKEAIIDKDKKISFLEKLIIEKDNKGYHLYRKNQKLEKQYEHRGTNINNLKIEIQKIKNENQLQSQKQKRQAEQNLRKQQNQFIKQIQIQNKVIKNLEEENKQMESLINKLRMNSTAAISNSMINQKSMVDSRRNNTISNSLIYDHANKVKEDSMEKSIKVPNFASTLSNYAQEAQYQSQQTVKKPRVRQTAQKRHSEDAIKTRKVTNSEVQQIGDLLKYRMIGSQIDSIQMKEYFNYKLREKKEPQKKQKPEKQEFILPVSQNPLESSPPSTPRYKDEQQEKKQEEWKTEYITMAEAEKIFQKAPFNLKPEQSQLLARYVIEDAEQEYVYCDKNNQNKRQVVKSILKALIGPYQLASEDIIQKYEDFMKKYSSNLSSSLESYYPQGSLSIRKFIEIFNNLGYEHASTIQNYIIAKLLTQAQDLFSVPYRHLFKNIQSDD